MNQQTQTIIDWIDENADYLDYTFEGDETADDVRESFLRGYVDDDANGIAERLLWILMPDVDWAKIALKVAELRAEVKSNE